MKVETIMPPPPPPPPGPVFILEVSADEAQRLLGILGGTMGRDADGIYDPLVRAVRGAGLVPITPRSTGFVYQP